MSYNFWCVCNQAVRSPRALLCLKSDPASKIKCQSDIIYKHQNVLNVLFWLMLSVWKGPPYPGAKQTLVGITSQPHKF